MTSKTRASLAREVPCCGEKLVDHLNGGGLEGFDTICSYISHPWCCLDPYNLPDKLPPAFSLDVRVQCGSFCRFLIPKISPWIDVDSKDEHLRKLSEEALAREIEYFRYCRVTGILIDVKRSNNPNLAKIINDSIKHSCCRSVWFYICVPLQISDDDEGEEDPWRWFYKIRWACDNAVSVALALKVTDILPKEAKSEKMKRYFGEPLKMIVVDTSLIGHDKYGVPTMDSVVEDIIKQFYWLTIQILVTGPDKHDTDQQLNNPFCKQKAAEKTHSPYYTYFNYLFKERGELSRFEKWSLGFEDCLEGVNRPVTEDFLLYHYLNMEDATSKYELYASAIDDALTHVSSTFVDEDSSSNPLVVMVLGAGRGPLVTKVVDSVDKCGMTNKVKIYAVEKNANAIPLLNRLRETTWKRADVTVVNSYFSDFHPPDKADIVISELLGGFGDNELSPECLDSAQHLMKDTCVSIPFKYSSFVVPMHSPKLHHAVLAEAEYADMPERAYENCYVVRPLNHYMIADPQELWSYDHPNFEQAPNDRFSELTFIAPESCECHGILGFFRAELFWQYRLSIIPKQHTTGLFSWFPFYFPLRYPVLVKKGEKITVQFWRRSNSKQVWYEWSLSSPIRTAIANVGGRTCSFPKEKM